jgi:hypothetical protein
MFLGLLELVSWFRQKHCECSEGCYRLLLQYVDCEMDFEGGMTVGDPNELLLAKMSFTIKYHRVPTGSGGRRSTRSARNCEKDFLPEIVSQARKNL